MWVIYSKPCVFMGFIILLNDYENKSGLRYLEHFRLLQYFCLKEKIISSREVDNYF